LARHLLHLFILSGLAACQLVELNSWKHEPTHQFVDRYGSFDLDLPWSDSSLTPFVHQESLLVPKFQYWTVRGEEGQRLILYAAAKQPISLQVTRAELRTAGGSAQTMVPTEKLSLERPEKAKDADAEAPLYRDSLVLFSITEAELLAMGSFTLEVEVLDADGQGQTLTFSFTHDTTRELAWPT